MLTPRDRLEGQRYTRLRLLATFLDSPDLAARSAWRPILFGLIVAVVLVVATVAMSLVGGDGVT